MFEELMEKAKQLEKMLDTPWAERHADIWDRFEDELNEAWENGDITDEQFDELATTAFYDYFDLKCDSED